MAGAYGRICDDNAGCADNLENRSNNGKYSAYSDRILCLSDTAPDIVSQIVPADIPLSAVKAVKTILFSDSKQAPPQDACFFIAKQKKSKFVKKNILTKLSEYIKSTAFYYNFFNHYEYNYHFKNGM